MRKVPCVCAVCASTIPELNIAQSVTVAKKNSHSLLNSIDIHRGPKLKQSRVSECICTNLTNKERCVEHLSFRVLLYSSQLRLVFFFIFRLFRVDFDSSFIGFRGLFHLRALYVRGLFGMAHLSRIASLFFPHHIHIHSVHMYSMGRENNALKMDCAICLLSSGSVFVGYYIRKGKNKTCSVCTAQFDSAVKLHERYTAKYCMRAIERERESKRKENTEILEKNRDEYFILFFSALTYAVKIKNPKKTRNSRKTTRTTKTRTNLSRM